jgi:hypothetical protein
MMTSSFFIVGILVMGSLFVLFKAFYADRESLKQHE